MSTQIPGPLLDPRPAFWHAASVADEACYLSGDESNGVSVAYLVSLRFVTWHASRLLGTLGGHLSGRSTSLQVSWLTCKPNIYVRPHIPPHTELHQLTSPTTAAGFLDNLLQDATGLEAALSDTAQFSQFIGRSWVGIIRSLGLT